MNRALIASVLVATLLATIPGVSSDAYGQPRPPRQNPQQQQQPPSIDAASREVFERFDEFVKTLDSFRVRFQATMDEPAEHSLGSEVVLNYLVGAQRPNKFAMIPTRIDRGMTVVCDGSNLYTYAPGPNQYLVEPAPPTLAQVLDAARLSLADMNMSLVVFIQMLLQDEPLTYLVSTAQKAEYVDDRDSDDKRDKALVDGYLDYEDTTYSKVEWESKGAQGGTVVPQRRSTPPRPRISRRQELRPPGRGPRRRLKHRHENHVRGLDIEQAPRRKTVPLQSAARREEGEHLQRTDRQRGLPPLAR